MFMSVRGPGVRALSVAELTQRLEEAETNIGRFSEELVQRLAVRDELEFEKEVKNSFISALIDVQNRQKEHRESLRKKKKLKGWSYFASSNFHSTTYFHNATKSLLLLQHIIIPG